jgi:hypothetical protein
MSAHVVTPRMRIPCPTAAAVVIALGVALTPLASHATVPTLSGTVFNDLNGDQSSDGGTDPGLGGWTVDLLDSTNVVVETTTTSVSGSYSLSPLSAAATYTVTEMLPSGWVGTLPATGSYAIPANLPQDVTGLDFGNFQLVSVSGSIYDDVNASGAQDPGEAGLTGRTAEIFDSGDNFVASAASDTLGDYTIDNVGPGSFTLHIVSLPGETVTQPTSPDYYSFTSSSGVNVSGGVFGLTGVTQAPEPMSLSVFGIALLALVAVRRARFGRGLLLDTGKRDFDQAPVHAF